MVGKVLSDKQKPDGRESGFQRLKHPIKGSSRYQGPAERSYWAGLRSPGEPVGLTSEEVNDRTQRPERVLGADHVTCVSNRND